MSIAISSLLEHALGSYTVVVNQRSEYSCEILFFKSISPSYVFDINYLGIYNRLDPIGGLEIFRTALIYKKYCVWHLE